MHGDRDIAGAVTWRRGCLGGGAVGDGAAEQEAVGRQAPQPTLYLHGARDGCIGADLVRGAERLLAPSSCMIVIDDAGHFLYLEEPGQVNDHILSGLS